MIQKNKLVKFREDKEKTLIFIKGWSFGINKSAYDIINFFDRPREIKDLSKYLHEKYHLSEVQFKEKVEPFIKNMIRQEILVKKEQKI